MLEGLGDPRRLCAADVGAGTGISAQLLAGRGVRVIAIEPNAAMRAAAVPHPRVELRDGTADHTGLPDASVELVLCAQAFHWFQPVPALAEFRRVLKPRGRLALLWNVRNRDDTVTAGYSLLVREAAGGRETEWRPEGLEQALRDGGFTLARQLEFAYSQELDLAGLIGRARSASYIPRKGPLLERLLAGLGELHARHADAAGVVRLVYRSLLYLAQPS